MNNLYIMCGLAFSGKSTLARKIAERTGSRLIAFDMLWIEKEKEQHIIKGDEGWRFIMKVAQDEIANTLKEGQSVVYDDTNVRFEHREEVREIARNLGVNPIMIYLNTPMELLRKREFTNKTTGERHDAEPENLQKVVEQLKVPTSNENVLEFTPNTDIENFFSELPK